MFPREERLIRRGRTRAPFVKKNPEKEGRKRRKEQCKCKARKWFSPEKMCTYQLVAWDLSRKIFNPNDPITPLEGKWEKIKKMKERLLYPDEGRWKRIGGEEGSACGFVLEKWTDLFWNAELSGKTQRHKDISKTVSPLEKREKRCGKFEVWKFERR